MMSGTLSTTAIVEAQGGWDWNVLSPWGLVAFLIFFTASLAETNRAPFDLPEAESEIIAGHLTEYSGFKYALFFLAEYVSMFAISGLAVTLFLGGWHGPWPVPSYLWFFGKMFALVGLMIWVRGTFPRLRADQLMGFAWKFLMPLALWNVVVTGLVFFLPRLAGWAVGALLLVGGYALLAKLNQNTRKFSTRIYRYADD
jgi:NADH-quinone oxidoreductase subunit H